MGDQQATADGIVLLVEDDPDIRTLAELSLQLAGLRVETCETGQMALSKLELRAYALVILDVMMPDMSGYEVMRRIVERLGADTPPIALFSACPPDDLLREAKSFGDYAPRVLKKPFEPAELAQTVKKIIGSE